jgi:hypothetical protein
VQLPSLLLFALRDENKANQKRQKVITQHGTTNGNDRKNGKARARKEKREEEEDWSGPKTEAETQKDV